MYIIPVIVLGGVLLTIGMLEYGAKKKYGKKWRQLPKSLKDCRLNPLSDTMIICSDGSYYSKCISFPYSLACSWYYDDGKSTVRIERGSTAHNDLKLRYEQLIHGGTARGL